MMVPDSTSMSGQLIVAGYGFVGKAVTSTFKRHYHIDVVDPKLGPETAADYIDIDFTEGVIICVNTPEGPDGFCDYSNVVDVLNTIDPAIPVLIKSAVDVPGVLAIEERFASHDIAWSPEFLRANTAVEDFANQKYVVFGSNRHFVQSHWEKIFRIVFPHIHTAHCTSTEAALVKYAENSFLATKTSFFNQLYDICQVTDGVNFNQVRDILCLDPRINRDYATVPGPDGKRGWGGHCFPKDTKAFVQYALSKDVPFTILEEVRRYNDKIRDE